MRHFVLYSFSILLLLLCMNAADIRKDSAVEEFSASLTADHQSLDDEVIFNVSLPDMQGYMERTFASNINESVFGNLKNQHSLFAVKVFLVRNALLSTGLIPAEKCFRALLGTRYMSGFYIYCLRQIII